MAERYEVSREQQDQWAVESHQKAVRRDRCRQVHPRDRGRRGPAAQEGPGPVRHRRAPRRDTSLEALAKLRPAFKKGGTVTAGNAPGVNDGAAAVVVTSAEQAKQLGVKPRAEIVAYAASGLAPELVMMAPEKAIRSVWEKTGWKVDDVDLYEINEAFSVQQVALGRVLGIPREKHNVRGGRRGAGPSDRRFGCARVDHAACTRSRIAIEEKGIAALCLGGGNAVAMAIRRI